MNVKGLPKAKHGTKYAWEDHANAQKDSKIHPLSNESTGNEMGTYNINKGLVL